MEKLRCLRQNLLARTHSPERLAEEKISHFSQRAREMGHPEQHAELRSWAGGGGCPHMSSCPHICKGRVKLRAR